jgi:hypothetical protein
MKKLLLMLSVLLVTTLSFAQSAANYTFSNSITGSLALANGNSVDMSTGTTQLYGTGVDTYTAAVTNIGFPFFLMGVGYTQFSCNPDGQIRLGSTLITGHTQSATSSVPYLIANNIDGKTDATAGKVHYKLIGSAPNRVLVIEWKNVLIYWNVATGNLSTYQARLYESTGVVEYAYGNMYHNNTVTSTNSIGFSVGTTAGQTGQLLTINTTPTYNSSATSFTTTTFAASSDMTNLSSALDGSRTVFTFTPPIAPNAPTALATSNATTTGMTLSWTDNASNEVGFAIYRSLDDVTYTFVSTVAANTVTTNVSGLTINTNYYWKVYALSEGALSTSADVQGATAAAAVPLAGVYSINR